ncbi:quinolinate synthase NadA [Caldibacillus thermoamylovorans]|uniref:Quinolinate synthase n=1 Tax=Caldibacillus thermoamylovorans TaxID=35841 RepID=A0ABD4A8B1_9BACI|nr:quinolinate synthase NadA [Caldibacillus thermoamylovorans]KIO60621.1 Quinolinate synthetase [Caldibacillus thermoamylovorans]KIO73036.1 Quinolinate synthetase [Caldibacillus thermoamylovorans]
MSLLEMAQKTLLPEHYKTMAVEEMEARVREIKERMGDGLFIPGHHYQKDEVIQFADAVGDSLQLAQVSAKNTAAEFVVFCGVHFMAETADILTSDKQKVILPDMRAGCSLADMANIEQTERGWKVMQEQFGDTINPLTYINSTAAIKDFVGRQGGATVTSSNARRMLEWAFTQKERVLFLPDQHLGRNTAYDLGVPLVAMAVWDPIREQFECDGDLADVKIILWKGHCSVHALFTVENVEQVRKNHPDAKIIVHPECSREVVALADDAGSTKYIIETIKASEPGTKWAVGTEMNLVNRLTQQFTDKEVFSLNPYMCACMTMNRIDLPHLLWALETVEQGKIINQITVEEEIAEGARLALDRMLARG